MEEMDLDIASEFLVMAATLLEIKSNMLLPKRKNDEDEMALDEDPRKELVEKLVEYKKYKEFSQRLREIEDCNEIYFKTPDIIDDLENYEVFFKNITLENLMHAFKKVVDSYENKYNKNNKIPEDIQYDEYKIEDKILEIKFLLEKHRRVVFQDFFKRAENRMEIIVIFLAMLEMIKLRYIAVLQNENFGDIMIEGQEELWKIS
jgi:segregation and condensation protein A